MWKRVWKLLVGAVAMVASAGWYIALVEPVAGRLAALHRRLHRQQPAATGVGLQRNRPHHAADGRHRAAGPGGPGGGPGGGGNLFFGGEPGIGRMFGASMGTEASWLLPAALIGLVAGLWLTRRTPRTDRLRASVLLWGGWLLVTAAVFSFMDGTIHPYYTVALAPAIAALVGISVRELWRTQRTGWPRGSCWRSCSRRPGHGRSFCWTARRTGCLRCGGSCWRVGAGGGDAGRRRAPARPGRSRYWPAAAILFARRAPAAYAVETVATAHSGPIVDVGPEQGRRVRFRAPRAARVAAAARAAGWPTTPRWPSWCSGLDNRWAAASIGSMGASGLELKTGASMMAIGGFTGGDDSPTLDAVPGLCRRRTRFGTSSQADRSGRRAVASRAPRARSRRG